MSNNLECDKYYKRDRIDVTVQLCAYGNRNKKKFSTFVSSFAEVYIAFL